MAQVYRDQQLKSEVSRLALGKHSITPSLIRPVCLCCSVINILLLKENKGQNLNFAVLSCIKWSKYFTVLLCFPGYNKTIEFTTFVEVRVNPVLPPFYLLQSSSHPLCTYVLFVWWHIIWVHHLDTAKHVLCRITISVLCEGGLKMWSYKITVTQSSAFGLWCYFHGFW